VKDLKVLEMVRTREETLCSGAGGGFPDVYPQQADGVAARRLDDAADTGSNVLVTTCPHAEMHLEKVSKRGNVGMSIVDLAELIAQAL
jgi:heterodisulfide reductase subunit D